MKFLILGDVHAEYEPFKKALDYAKANNLFVISVGDLVDNGPNGYQVCRDMLELVRANRGAVIWGNHEWKIYRWLLGNPVTLGGNNQLTAEQMESNPEFKKVFLQLVEHCHNYLQINNKIFVTHAGINPSFWETQPVTTKKDLGVFKYGQSDQSKTIPYKGEVYPLRVYDWVKKVPAGVKLFVGHDPRPMEGTPDFDNFQKEPSTHYSGIGGTTIFLDCGAGKGGWLYGAVVNSVDESIIEYINFSK